MLCVEQNYNDSSTSIPPSRSLIPSFWALDRCDNLLCDLRDLNNPVVKIGDLGLSKNKQGSFTSGNMRGTLPWMAPELFPSVQGDMLGTGGKGLSKDLVTEKVSHQIR